MNPGIGRGGERGLASAKDGNSPHSVKTANDRADHVFQVTNRTVALEQDQLELVVEQGDGRRKLEIAAVVPDAAGQGETGAELSANGLNCKFGQAPAQVPKAANPVSNLPQRAFHSGVQVIDDVRVQPGARH